MENKLRAHMDHLFRDVPPSKQATEIKEEILQNILDKYHDLIAEGKSEEAAYNIAIASIGDLDELLQSLKKAKPESASVQSEEYWAWKKKSAVRVAIAVMLYILCVVPPIICDIIGINDELGAVGLFVFIAIATGIIIYNNMTKPSYVKNDDTIMEDFKEWQTRNDTSKQTWKSIKGALWSIIVVLYFIISFSTGSWYVTWVIFLIGAALKSILKVFFGNGLSLSKSTGNIIQLIVGCVIALLLIFLLVYGLCRKTTFPFLSIGWGDTYDNAEKYTAGSGSLPVDDLNTLNINWIAGEVTVTPSNSDSIEILEEGGESMKDSDKVHYYYHDGILDIQYRESGKSLASFGLSDKKNLTVKIPQKLCQDIKSLQGDFVNADASINGIAAKKLSIETVSGDFSFDSSARDISIDTVSGDCQIRTTITPESINTDSVSGDITISIPGGSEFQAEYDSVSGDFTCDLPYTSKETDDNEGTIINGSSDNEYEFDSVSGDIFLTAIVSNS